MKRITTALLILFLTTAQFSCSDNPADSSENEFYTKTIERIAENEFEEELIEKAETEYPPRDSVLAAVSPWQQELVPETEYWWYSRYEGVYLPFALTIDAIEYYESFIDSLAAEEQDDYYKTAELEYEAKVSFHDSFKIYEQGYTNPTPDQLLGSFEEVYVVEMTLGFRFECFVHCLLGASKSRVAVFNKEGNLLEIFHDGATPQIVA
ncbi:hypothetical protein [Gracilimonas sediminicola]|uniref:Beta-lactamase-inhibitor-like, PepSY-like n=1 Tax=Gracilimonas sediminicola TaxID=2952158 RepID=A0A9X2RH96_9BACT|nr:hypothetical protein [Gracilimonas sediminicola]MCP9292093.1 hypothetical protein [Gracilimonas sediminicola]